MNNQINLHKQNLETALHYISIILDCEEKIKVGRHVNYFKGVKNEAIHAYADAMAELMEHTIDMSKIELVMP